MSGSDISSRLDEFLFRFRWPIGSVLVGVLLLGTGLTVVRGRSIRAPLPSPTNAPDVPSETKPSFININTADQTMLESLPGIGPTKAKAIVDFRQKNGSFKRIEDLLKVPGIGPKTLDGIRDQIRVE